MKTAIIYMLMILLKAHAEPGQRIEQLLAVRSTLGLETAIARLHSQTSSTKFCKIEMEKELLPIHCLQLLNFRSSSFYQNAQMQSQISRQCVRAVKKQTSGSELKEQFRFLQMDPDCATAATKHLQKLRYIHPESTLSWH